MSEKLFPKRPKLKVKFVGPLSGKTQEVFFFKTMKELQAKEDWYRSVYKPTVVEFTRVQGMIEIHEPPAEMLGTVLMPGKSILELFSNPPLWHDTEGVVWGKGFENTWYIADEHFTHVIKLKKI